MPESSEFLSDPKIQRLRERIREIGPVMVAFSGGIDSSLLSWAAHHVFGDQALAVTAASPTSASHEPRRCAAIAGAIGIPHLIVESSEMDDPAFVANTPDRCYQCKRIRMSALCAMAAERGLTVVEGSNADDANDYRPGHRAIEELGVKSPLSDVGLPKSEIRRLAKMVGLPNWDQPSIPCLATRLAYGLPITTERLARIDKAEQRLRDKGIPVCRVRYHEGDLARIEVPVDSIAVLVEPPTREEINAYFESLGFRYVSVDLAGFASGRMNLALTREQLADGAENGANAAD